MIPARRPRASWLLALLLLGATSVWADPAEPDPVGDDASEAGIDLPPGLQIDWQGSFTQTEDGAAAFTGPVTITWQDSRIQADRLSIRDRRYIVAEGNVLIVWGGNRIFGSRMDYDLEEERGIIRDAIGSALDEYLFSAREVEKIGDRKLHLVHATVTTCTQPVPYWSFAVSSATITIDRYARMWNVRLRASKAPVVYLPYLVWPVKEGRAAGLLMPEFHTTENRGRVISQEMFIPLGRSADLTLLGRYYDAVGFGGGAELRFVPNLSGGATISGFYIKDDFGEFAGKGRYRVDYQQTQQFRNGFRMVADMEAVSDEKYFSDFERDLNVASSPQTLARLEFSRNGSWISTNVREVRREQLASGLVQQALPEIEWRGRSRRLWKSPFYLSFESSIASIQQRKPVDEFNADLEQGFEKDSDYLRGDIAPTLTLPWSPTRWLDITPTVKYRYTYYTQRQFEAVVETEDGTHEFLAVDDSALNRRLWAYGVEIVGPKLFKIFDRPKSGARYKHSIEPKISYGFAESFDNTNDILKYDEVDSVRGSGTQMNYSLVQRLFAKRQRAEPSVSPTTMESIVLPDGTTAEGALVAEKEAASNQGSGEEEAPPAPEEPVEIASITLSQSRSFDDDLSRKDFDGDGIYESTSRTSPISITGRFNPGPGVSLDLRSTYDILYDDFRDASLSGNLRNHWSSVQFSVVHRNGLAQAADDSTQVRLDTRLSFLRRKLELRAGGSYNADPEGSAGHFPDQRWQLQYRTQCCTFLVERVTRDFALPEDRREIYFRVDLTGVGKLFDQSF